MKTSLLAFALCLLLGLAPTPGQANTTKSFDVSIDTTALAGTSGYLAFDLVAGSPASTSSVSVIDFLSTGTLGSSSSAGDALGSLSAPPLVLTASTFYSGFLQGIDFGAGFTSFRLDLSAAYDASAIPDSFAFFLLDATQTPIETSDPTGAGALFVIDLDAVVNPQVFDSPLAQAALTLVPEPASVLMMLAGLGLLLAWRRPLAARSGNREAAS